MKCPFCENEKFNVYFTDYDEKDKIRIQRRKCKKCGKTRKYVIDYSEESPAIAQPGVG